jgi:hypothetical protein
MKYQKLLFLTLTFLPFAAQASVECGYFTTDGQHYKIQVKAGDFNDSYGPLTLLGAITADRSCQATVKAEACPHDENQNDCEKKTAEDALRIATKPARHHAASMKIIQADRLEQENQSSF